MDIRADLRRPHQRRQGHLLQPPDRSEIRRLESLRYLCSSKHYCNCGDYDMAAFCACCGAEITLKPQACPRCGTPRHGMSPPPDLPRTLDAEADPQKTSKRGR
jgi:hypothetical protein